MKREWYRMQASADGGVVDLYIFDEIGQSFFNDGAVTAKGLVDELAQLPASVRAIHVHVNSPGGDPFEATAIANALRDQRDTHGRAVDTTVEGLAASAASIVIMAGSNIRIADNALVMIHNPYSLAFGDAEDHRKTAAALDAIRGSIVTTYQWHSSKSADDLGAMMDADTWMDADQAIANGFATEKIEGLQIAASFDRRVLATLKAPAPYRARIAALVKPEARPAIAAAPGEVLALCKKHACLALAEGFIAAGAPLETVSARVTEAGEIRALCAVAKLPAAFADMYIDASIPAKIVRAHALFITATIDGSIQIDPSLGPCGGRTSTYADHFGVFGKTPKSELSGGSR